MESPERSESRRTAIEVLPLSELFLWGQVRRPHGLRGHLIVEAFAEEPTRYDLRRFWVAGSYNSEATPYAVASLRPYASVKASRYWRLRFQGISDRTAAERFVRAELYLPRSFLPPLPEGQFYYIEALGAQVVDQLGLRRGVLQAIHPGGAYDFFLVEDEKGAVFWVPAPFVQRLDRSTAPPTLFVVAPEGIWDPSLANGTP